MDKTDPFNLVRFEDAQHNCIEDVLEELRSGEKRTHWMWYIFPQLAGLGRSTTAQHYAIRSLYEASEYLAHPILEPRLIECCRALLLVTGKTASEIMGYPDDVKLRSSMTLFACVPDADPVFQAVLDKYFQGEADPQTMQLLQRTSK